MLVATASKEVTLYICQYRHWQHSGRVFRETNETHCCIIEVKVKQARIGATRIDLPVTIATKLTRTCPGLSAHQLT